MNEFLRSTQFAGGRHNSGAATRESRVSSPSTSRSAANATTRSGDIPAFSSAPAPSVGALLHPSITPGVLVNERLAQVTDEGLNSANQRELIKHIEGQFEGRTIEDMIEAVVRAEEQATK